MLMSNTSGSEYLHSIRPRHRKEYKKEKNKILDEFCSVCGYNRKYTIRLLNQKPPSLNKFYMKRSRNLLLENYPSLG